MKNWSILIIFCLFVLLSCGKQNKTVSSKLSVISTAALYQRAVSDTYKNVVVYGNSSDGKWFTKVLTEDSLTVEIPSGEWNFYAVTWESTVPDKFTGQSECAKQERVKLDEKDVNVELVTKDETCEESPFTSFNLDIGLEDLVPNLPIFMPYSCSEISTIQRTDNYLQNLCEASLAGTALYYRVTLFQEYNFGDTKGPRVPKLISTCQPINQSNAYTTNFLRIPQNLPGNTFVIDFFSSNKEPCSDSDGSERAFLKLENTDRVKHIPYYLIGGDLPHKVNAFYHEINKANLHNPARVILARPTGINKLKLTWQFPGDITTKYHIIGSHTEAGASPEACKGVQAETQSTFIVDKNISEKDFIFTTFPLSSYYVRICSTDGNGRFTKGILKKFPL